MAVTNLIGTRWKMNEILTTYLPLVLTGEFLISFTYTDTGETFGPERFDQAYGESFFAGSWGLYNRNGWIFNPQRDIPVYERGVNNVEVSIGIIWDSSLAENPDVIDFFETNATQIIPAYSNVYLTSDTSASQLTRLSNAQFTTYGNQYNSVEFKDYKNETIFKYEKKASSYDFFFSHKDTSSVISKDESEQNYLTLTSQNNGQLLSVSTSIDNFNSYDKYNFGFPFEKCSVYINGTQTTVQSDITSAINWYKNVFGEYAYTPLPRYLTDDGKKIVVEAAIKDSKGQKITETYATKTELGNKQNTLSTAQLNAVNSGITSSKVTTYDGYASGKQDVISDLSTIRSGAQAGATAVQPEAGKGLFSGSYNDLTGKPTIPDISGKLDANKIQYSSTDIGEGAPLATGTFYFVYE